MFHTYSDKNPPKRGNAKLIFAALKASGLEVRDLHYNANCWGMVPENGWQAWAAECNDPHGRVLGSRNSYPWFFCLVDRETKQVFAQQPTAPYALTRLPLLLGEGT